MAESVDIKIASKYDNSGVVAANESLAKLARDVGKADDAMRQATLRSAAGFNSIAAEADKAAIAMGGGYKTLEEQLDELKPKQEGMSEGMKKTIGMVGKFVPGFSKLGAAGASAFGAVAIAVGSLIALGKSLYDMFDKIFRFSEDKPLKEANNALASMRSEAEVFAGKMEEAREKAADLTKSFNAEVDALNKLTQAQLEFNRAQEIAVAKSQEERDAINARYKDASAEAANDAERKKLDRRSEDLTEERNRLELELRKYTKLEREADNVYKKNSALADERAKDVGGVADYTGAAFRGIGRFITFGQASINKETDAVKAFNAANEGAVNAMNQRDEYREKIADVRKRIDDVRERDKLLASERQAFEMRAEAGRINRETEAEDRENAEAERIEEARKKQEEADRMAAEKLAAERIKAAEAEARAREKMEADLHRQRIEDAKAEVAEAQKQQASASSLASSAQSEFDRAFAMYRDKDLAASTIAEERDYAADYKRLGKDASRYGGKWRIDELASLMAAGDTQGQAAKLEEWRKSSKFTPEVEAMVRASAADQTRTTAEAELRKIAANTEGLAQKLDELLQVK